MYALCEWIFIFNFIIYCWDSPRFNIYLIKKRLIAAISIGMCTFSWIRYLLPKFKFSTVTYLFMKQASLCENNEIPFKIYVYACFCLRVRIFLLCLIDILQFTQKVQKTFSFYWKCFYDKQISNPKMTTILRCATRDCENKIIIILWLWWWWFPAWRNFKSSTWCI